MENDFYCSAGNSRHGAVCLSRWRTGAAPVELAAAAALRLAPAYVLASAWTSGAMPDSLRRIRIPRWPLARPMAHERAHGRLQRSHDAGRAGTIPAAHERNLRRGFNGCRELGRKANRRVLVEKDV